MLSKFKELLKSSGLHIEKELKDIRSSFCEECTTKFLSFDEITESFSNNIGVGNYLKSVDALFISDTTHNLYLIEWTRYEEFLKRGNTPKDFFEKQFQFELLNKAVDSIFTLLAISGYHKIDEKFYSYFLDAHHAKTLKVKLILLTNMNSMDLLAFDQASLSKQYIGLTARIGKPIFITNCAFLNQLLPIDNQHIIH